MKNFSVLLLSVAVCAPVLANSNLTAEEYERIVEQERSAIRNALARDDFNKVTLIYKGSKRWQTEPKERLCQEYAEQPVHYALHFKDDEIARELVLKNKALLLQQDAVGMNPLVRTIYTNQTELLGFFLEHCEDDKIEQILEEAFTLAKQHAIKHRTSNSVLSVIIHHIIHLSDDHIAPLIWAIKKEDVQAVHVILKEPDINVNVTDQDGNSALMYAVQTRNKQLVGFLAEKGALCYAQNTYNWSPLEEAIFVVKDAELLTILLIEHIKNTDWARTKGFTPLLWVASQGDIGAMQLLVDMNKKCLKDRDSDGNNSVYWASINGHFDAVRLLKELGVELAQKNRMGWTPLAASVRDGNDSVLPLLYDADSYCNERDEFGWTPLIKAARFNQLKCLEALLELGVNPNEQDNDGNTALHWAARYGLKDCALSLINHGADVNAISVWGFNPLFWACRNHHASIVRILLEYGAEEDDQHEYGWTLGYSKITGAIKVLLGFGHEKHA